MSGGPQLTPLRSKAVRRHFFSMSLFGSGNQLFNIAAVAVFLWVSFTIVTCLGNATVTETAAECYWKSMVKAGLDRHDDHGSLSWFLQSPHDSNSIPEYRKDLPVYPESWTLESEIQLKESGIPLTIGIRNESGIQYVKSLGLPYVERNRAQGVWKQADVGTV